MDLITLSKKRKYQSLASVALILVGAGLILICGFGLGGAYSAARSTEVVGTAPVVDAKAPDFELDSLSGPKVSLSDYSGRPVLVNFWATWCTPCIEELPLIKSRFERYKPGLIVLAITDEPQEDVLPFVNQNGLPYMILFDSQDQVFDQYRVRGFPSTYFVDRDGVIRAIQIGVLSETDIDRYLKLIGVGE